MSFGRFLSIADYLAASTANDSPRSCHADDYVAPYLRQACRKDELDPISRWPNYWSCWAQLQAASTLAAEAVLLGGGRPQAWRTLWEAIQQEFDQLSCVTSGSVPATLLQSAGRLQLAAAVALGEALGGRSSLGQLDSPLGWLVINPSSHVARQLICDVNIGPASAGIYATGPAVGEPTCADVVVDVPAHGFVWLDAVSPAASNQPGLTPIVVEQQDYIALRNEFFDARINRATGALRAIYDFVARGNRLSQRLVSRSADEESTTMVADQVGVVAASGIRGEVRSTGRLVGHDGVSLGKFELVYAIQRGSRLLGLTIRLDELRSVVGEPWRDYLGLRSIWPNESSQLVRCVNELPQVTDARNFESPLYVEIDDLPRRTAIIGRGLPYHLRADHRQLDTLLCVRGESARSFQLDVGIDLPATLATSLNQLAQPVTLTMSDRPTSDTGWLFHRDVKRVHASDWRPVWSSTAAAPVGFRVTLLELAGRGGAVTIRAFRPVSEAGVIDLEGNKTADCEVIDGTIRVSLAAHEWTQVEARW